MGRYGRLDRNRLYYAGIRIGGLGQGRDRHGLADRRGGLAEFADGADGGCRLVDCAFGFNKSMATAGRWRCVPAVAALGRCCLESVSVLRWWVYWICPQNGRSVYWPPPCSAMACWACPAGAGAWRRRRNDGWGHGRASAPACCPAPAACW